MAIVHLQERRKLKTLEILLLQITLILKKINADIRGALRMNPNNLWSIGWGIMSLNFGDSFTFHLDMSSG